MANGVKACLALLAGALALAVVATTGCVQREVEVTREVNVPVTVVVEREVVETREVNVPVTVVVERAIDVIREVNVPVTVVVEREVEVTREVNVPVTVVVERNAEIIREVNVPVTVVVEREVVIDGVGPGDLSLAHINRWFDLHDRDGDRFLTPLEVCEQAGDQLSVEDHIWLHHLRLHWWQTEDDEVFDLHIQTQFMTNEQLCFWVLTLEPGV